MLDFLTVAAFSLLQSQDPALDLDALPARTVEVVEGSGDAWTYTVVDHPQLGALRHGPARWVRADGSEAATGDFEAGARDGRWRFRWPNGELMASGRYREGSKAGKWSFKYSNDDLGDDGDFASGGFIDGLRDGRWTFHDAEGERSTVEYEAVVEEYEGGGLLRCGVLRDGQVDGRWTIWWSDGRLASEQHFLDGRQVGRARAFHPDGFEEPVLFARGSTEDEVVQLVEWIDGDRRVEREARLRAPTEASSLDVVERELRLLSDRLRERDEPAAQRARARAVAIGAVWSLLGPGGPSEPLAALEEMHGKSAVWALARSAFCGDVYALQSILAEPDRARRFLARATTVARVTAWDPLFQAFAGPDALRVRTEVEFDGEEDAVALLEDLRRQRERIAFKPGASAETLRELAEPSVERAVARGLHWLAMHQKPSGEWDPAEFHLLGDHQEKVVARTGRRAFRYGITALALQAFLDAGKTLEDPDHGPAMLRAVEFLLAAQNLETGRIGYLEGDSVNYAHSAATIALAGVQRTTPHPEIRAALERAIGTLLDAKATYGGVWAYETENPGISDTSVTAWAWRALHEASDAIGQPLSESLSREVILYFNEVTSSDGRAGYRELGQNSSRLESAMEAFPAKESEALTACALLVRARIEATTGVDARTHDFYGLGFDAIDEAVALIRRESFEWRGSGGTDLYYWFYGARALRLLSEEHPYAWRSWREGLGELLVEKQIDEGEESSLTGSWPTDTAWGSATGAVFTTSMAISILCGL